MRYGAAPATQRFLRDDDGAVMVVGAFMAILAVGLLYHLAGIGETVLYQERLQDAADTSAFAAAATHARAMNALAVVNASMAVVMASVSALNLSVLAAQLCVDFQIIRFPRNFCPDLLARYAAIHDDVSPGLLAKLRQGTSAGDALVETTPTLAAREVERIVTARAGDAVRRALLVPAPVAVSRTTTEPLCALANLHVFRLTQVAMGIDLLDRIIPASEPRIGRALPHCEQPPGVGAFTTRPAARPVGSDAFQVRVVIVGDTRRLRGLMRGTRMPAAVIARRGEDTRRFVRASTPDPQATLVVAQAEYYSSWEYANLPEDTDTNSVEEDAFHMDWRARLRRFRVRTGESAAHTDPGEAYRRWVTDELIPACGTACTDTGSALELAGDALH
jgi:hypothetical protein